MNIHYFIILKQYSKYLYVLNHSHLMTLDNMLAIMYKICHGYSFMSLP